MYCNHCGAVLQPDQRFCATCGQLAPRGIGPVTQGRLARHLRLLGVFWIVISAFRLIGALAVLIVGRVMFSHRRGGWGGPPELISSILSIVGLCLLIGAIAGFLVAAGLLSRRQWARTLALILGGISLLDIPLGTALGFYTLWALLPPQSEQEYRQMSGAT